MLSRSNTPLPVVIATFLALAVGDRCGGEPTSPELDALRSKLTSELTFTRRVAVEKLGSMGSNASPALPGLISALESDPDAMVRTRAAWALAEIKQPVIKTVPALLTATCDSNPGVRENALAGLRSIGLPAVPQLEDGLKSKDAQIRVSAARTLLALDREPEEACLATLRGAFTDPSPEIRQGAVNGAALAGAGALPLIPHLVVLLDDPDAGVRAVTVSTLAKIDSQGASETALIRVLAKDSAKGVRGAAATALGQIATPTEQRIPALLDAFKDSDEVVRANASHALAKLGPITVPALLETLTSTSVTVRELAVDTLLGLGPQAQPAVDSLIALLGGEPESKVRFRVAGALGAIGDKSPKVLDALEQSAANDKDPTVRAHATSALRTLHAPARP